MTELTSFEHSNRVRITKVFEGASLVYEEPTIIPIHIPQVAKPPPWIDPDVDYISEEFTYVDGEWVNLAAFDIAGTETIEDIDLDKDGNLPKHEILVYFAKFSQALVQEVDF